MSLLSKGQYSVEFILNYGWILISIITLIGLIAYFGLLNPNTFITEQCIVQYSVYCTGKALTNETNTLIVVNSKVNFPFTLDSSRVELPNVCSGVEFCDKNGNNCANSKLINIDDSIMIKLYCDNKNKNVVRYSFKIYYTNTLSGLKEELNLYIVTKVLKNT